MVQLFKKKIKSCLGIDIGTASIKIAQLKKEAEKFELETYGEISTKSYLERLNDAFQVTSLKTLEAVTRELLRVLLEKAETSTRQAVMTIPVFSSFVSVVEVPEMAEKELSHAIEFEARRYVPIPVSEVILDWRIIEAGLIKDDISPRPFKGKRILLIAVPTEVINKYLKIADNLGLKILALELESFSLARSLMSGDRSSACILDIGARASSFTIFDRGTIQMSHSLDIAGAEMTKSLSVGLGVASQRAEEFKVTFGLDHQENYERRKEIKELLHLPLEKIVDEIERMILSYQMKTDRKIEKLILNGGSASLVGLEDYIQKRLNIKAVVASPWSRVVYPTALQLVLRKIGPEFSVAVGAAMREG
ncbi:MAG: hypothetical protein A2V69_02995 [Candidatus Portnoybacteria bacterium RBG_13_40_8]|uniref:SHS2 domain-containing protein n=1 Tax=Candidatus Portnoybacteria bacterium RBG_13_40_8 TaxID=1801990 RepID=A0A1G2F4E3_9BACT|nr:MAG: hypothetical protein A2V69_02995 [Candidatus Portnoybacteria bacterium RBG_13_40_8]OGZ35534.1 MAG: hypothetical protein A2V60_02430 [Candidatus Portnoybacteria bacterium RIFCSPHIGHO2_01_FULL_39_19]